MDFPPLILLAMRISIYPLLCCDVSRSVLLVTFVLSRCCEYRWLWLCTVHFETKSRNVPNPQYCTCTTHILIISNELQQSKNMILCERYFSRETCIIVHSVGEILRHRKMKKKLNCRAEGHNSCLKANNSTFYQIVKNFITTLKILFIDF